MAIGLSIDSIHYYAFHDGGRYINSTTRIEYSNESNIKFLNKCDLSTLCWISK